MQPLQNCIGPTIRIGQEILCLPYAGFFVSESEASVSRMPSNTALDTVKLKEFNQIADLKKRTQQTSNRNFGYFKEYLASQQEKSGEAVKTLGELLNCKARQDLL